MPYLSLIRRFFIIFSPNYSAQLLSSSNPRKTHCHCWYQSSRNFRVTSKITRWDSHNKGSAIFKKIIQSENGTLRCQSYVIFCNFGSLYISLKTNIFHRIVKNVILLADECTLCSYTYLYYVRILYTCILICYIYIPHFFFACKGCWKLRQL